MQLGGQKASGNVEDRRGIGALGGGLGVGGIVIAVKRGMDSGRAKDCDTLSGSAP